MLAGGVQPAGVAVAPEPSWPGFRTLTVTGVVAESAAVTSFRLAADEALPAFEAGQFLSVRVREAGDPAPVRSYSLSGDPVGGEYRISVKAEPDGGISARLRALLHPGDQVEVAAPRGGFVLDDGDAPVVLVSAGIGVTPVLAMLHRLASTRSTREVWWIHTTHDEQTQVLGSEAADLVAHLPRARSLVLYTTPSRPLPAGARAGRLTAAVITGLELPIDAIAYVCGPEPFMDDIVAALTAVGLDPSRVRTEQFGSRSPINPGVVAADAPPPHQPPVPPGTGPAVTFARSGLSTGWSDRYDSVLELAEACDVPTQWSCRTGVCHTCVTAVLAGSASYGTPPLEPPGDDELLICSARPTTDLVIDL